MSRLPLTRRALAAHARFERARDDRFSAEVARSFGLSGPEVEALVRWENNIERLGDPAQWTRPWRRGTEVARHGLAPLMMEGLELRASGKQVVERLRYLDYPARYAVEEAIDQWAARERAPATLMARTPVFDPRRRCSAQAVLQF